MMGYVDDTEFLLSLPPRDVSDAEDHGSPHVSLKVELCELASNKS